MAKVIIRRGESEFEVSDLTFEQVKELVGVNGYGKHVPTKEAPVRAVEQTTKTSREPDFAGFLASLKERPLRFIEIMRSHPNGIEANMLAGMLGFIDARQIGGVTGGGLGKAAKRNRIKLSDVYRSKATFPNGKRLMTFYPGKLLRGLQEVKPAA
jgi:hypothetical protein